MITSSSRSLTLMMRDKCMTSEHHGKNLLSVWKGWGVLCSDHPFFCIANYSNLLTEILYEYVIVQMYAHL